MADPFAKPNYSFTPRPDLAISARRAGGSGGFASSASSTEAGAKGQPSSSEVAALLRGRLQQIGGDKGGAPAERPAHLRESKVAASPAEQLRWRFSQGQKQLYGDDAVSPSQASTTCKTFLKVLVVLALFIGAMYFVPPPASFLPEEEGTVQPEVIASIDEAPTSEAMQADPAETGAPEGMSVQVHEATPTIVEAPVLPGFEQGSTEAAFASETGVTETALEQEATAVGAGDAADSAEQTETEVGTADETAAEAAVSSTPPATMQQVQGELALSSWDTKLEQVEEEAVPTGLAPRRIPEPTDTALEEAPAPKVSKKKAKGKKEEKPKSKVAQLRSSQVHKAEEAITQVKAGTITSEAALKLIYPLLTAHAQTYGKGLVNSHSGEVPEQTKLYSELATKRKSRVLCETGFNAGHSAVNWLLHSPVGATYVGFDAGNSTQTADKYPEKNANMVNKLANYLNGEASSAEEKHIKLHWGDVAKNVEAEAAKHTKCDLIHVDGSRLGANPIEDLRSMFKLANESTLVIMDGAVGTGTQTVPQTQTAPTVMQVWAQAQKEGWVKEAKCHQFQAGRGFCYGRFKKTGRSSKGMPWEDPIKPAGKGKKDAKKDDVKDSKKKNKGL